MMEKRTAKTVLLALTLVAIVTLSTLLLQAQTSPENTEAQAESQNSHGRLSEFQAQRLEGSWDIIVTPVVPPGVPPIPPIHAYGTYARGGAAIGADRTRPNSKQHGVWEHLGGNRFAVTMKEDLFDPLGNFSGLLSIRVRITIIGRDEFIGVAQGEQRDANGGFVFTGCTTVNATRIKIEPLSAQCQNITPPR